MSFFVKYKKAADAAFYEFLHLIIVYITQSFFALLLTLGKVPHIYFRLLFAHFLVIKYAAL